MFEYGALKTATPSRAAAATAGTIEVKDAWIRSTPPGAPTAAGYATIVNHGFTSDRLTGASTRADLEQAGAPLILDSIAGILPHIDSATS